MQDFEDGNLKITVTEESDKHTMMWIGQSDARDSAVIVNPYLDEFLNNFKGKELVLDFQNLDYMNSSSIAPIIQFIFKLNKKAIKTAVLYSAALKWQKVSFKAIEALSKAMPSISVIGV